MRKNVTVFEIAMNYKGISGAQIARTLGVGEAAVSHWKHGRFYVPKKHQHRVAEILGVSVDELFDERGVPKVGEG